MNRPVAFVDDKALSSNEIEIIRAQRRLQEQITAFEQGVNAAANLFLSWAEQGNGGEGKISEYQRNMAAAMRNLRHPGAL